MGHVRRRSCSTRRRNCANVGNASAAAAAARASPPLGACSRSRTLSQDASFTTEPLRAGTDSGVQRRSRVRFPDRANVGRRAVTVGLCRCAHGEDLTRAGGRWAPGWSDGGEGGLARLQRHPAGCGPALTDPLDPFALERLLEEARARRAAAQAGAESTREDAPPATLGDLLDPVGLEQRLKQARARRAAAQAGPEPGGQDVPPGPGPPVAPGGLRGEPPARSRTALPVVSLVAPPRPGTAARRRDAHAVGLFLAGLCLGAVAAIVLASVLMRGRVSDLIAPEAAPGLLTGVVEPPAVAANAAPAPAGIRPTPRGPRAPAADAPGSATAALPAAPEAPAADARATVVAALPAGAPAVGGVAASPGPAAVAPTPAAPAAAAGAPRGPAPAGLAGAGARSRRRRPRGRRTKPCSPP